MNISKISERMNLLFVLFLPTVSLIIAILTLGHYGINWDEPYHYRRGQAFLHFFLTGEKTYKNLPKYPALKGDSDNPNFRNAQKNFEEVQKNPSLSDPHFRRSFYQDDSWNGEYFIDIENPFGHPPLNDILAASFNQIFYQKLGILGDLESYHLFIVLVVSLITFFMAIFMWKKYGILESMVSSITFSAYPLILGEQHFNIKDPVETSFYTFTIISFYLGITKNSLFWLFLSTLGFAFAFSTKFNIIFSIIPMGLWLLYFLYKSAKSNKSSLLKKIAITLVFTPLITSGIFFASFPSLWKDPIGRLSQILRFYLEVGHSMSQPLSYYLFGFINTYPLLWILLTTPPIVLFLFLLSLIVSKKIINTDGFVLLLIIWIIISVGRISLFGALSYGGVRLIMEYIPPLAMLAGIAAGYITKINKKRIFSVLSILLLIFGFTPTIIKLIQIHPNENVYFNFIVGGLSGAKEKNIPSWGNSNGNAYYPGILWLNQNAESNSRISVPVGNTNNIPRFKLRPDLAISPYYWSGLKHQGEYLIELTYDYPPKDWFTLKYLNEAVMPIYEVKVDNVAIAKVWKNDLSKVKEKFKKTTTTEVGIRADINSRILQIELASPQRVMGVKIVQPTKNCEPVRTGYVESSIDSKNWIREPEDIAEDQLNRQELKKLDPTFSYFFVAREAKLFHFHLDSGASCLLRARRAFVTFLEKF